MRNIFKRKTKKHEKKFELWDNINSIDDIFTLDKINEILTELNENKTQITKLVVVYETSDDYVHARQTNMTELEELGLMEYAKTILTTDNEEE